MGRRRLVGDEPPRSVGDLCLEEAGGEVIFEKERSKELSSDSPIWAR